MNTIIQIPKGQINVACKSKSIDPLIEESVNFTALASATTELTPQYTTTTGRGLIQAIRVIVGAVISDAAQLELSVSVNDMEMIKNTSGMEFIIEAQNDRSYRNIVIPEKAIITATAVNGSTENIPIAIILYYQDPYGQVEYVN